MLPRTNSKLSAAQRRKQPAGKRTYLLESLESRQMLTTVTVDSLSDSSVNDGFTTLREAIVAANADSSIDEIVFDSALTASGNQVVIRLNGDPLLISSGVTISGPGADLVMVNARGRSRAFEIDNSDPVLESVRIDGITITGGVDIEGGAIWNLENLRLDGVEITGNSADLGGGILNSHTLLVTNSTIYNNNAGIGAGIMNEGIASIYSSTISGNSSDIGAGIANQGGGRLNLTHVTVSGNLAEADGAGISNQGVLNLKHATVTMNNAVDLVGGVSNFGTFTAQNSIIAGNEGGFVSDIEGASTGSHNFIGDPDGAGDFNNGLDGNIVGNGFGGNIDITEILEPLADNGGATKTHSLVVGSAPINAGDSALTGGLTLDQRGAGFARVIGGSVDIGALELNHPPAFSSPSYSEFAENGTPQITVVATDVEDGSSPTLLAVGGADQSRFDFNPATGLLALNFAPDFETPLDADGDSRYDIEISATDSQGKATTQLFSFQIVDTQAGVLITVSTVNDGAEAGSTAGVFRFEQAETFTTDTIISYGLSGTATEVFDFSELAGTVTIPAGQTAATLSIPVIDDQIVETAETVNVEVLGATGAGDERSLDLTLGVPTGSLNINDNDATVVYMENTRNSSENNGRPIEDGVVTVVQTKLSTTDTVAAYTILNTSTATSGVDFVPLSGTVTIPAGQRTATIPITIIEDTEEEDLETIQLRLVTILSGNGAILTTSEASLAASNTIASDDFAVSAPAFNESGNTVVATASAGDDIVELVLGDQIHLLTINGVEQSYDASVVDTFHIGGSFGENSIKVTGTDLDDTASMIGSKTQIKSANYTVNTYSFDVVHFEGGGGNDLAQIFGSSEDDVYTAFPWQTTMTNPSNTFVTSQFERVDAFGRGGDDRAQVFGTTGNDVYSALDKYEVLDSANLKLVTKGFERVDAYSRGGNDRAQVFGTNGDDTYTAFPTHEVLEGVDLKRVTKGFARVDVFGRGGIDTATMYDSAGDDLFAVITGNGSGDPYGYFKSVDGKRHRLVKGFENVDAYSDNGGSDLALLLDNPNSADDLRVGLSETIYSAGAQQTRLLNFERIDGRSTGGSDTARFQALRSLDTVFANGDQAKVFSQSEDRDQTVTGFSTVVAEAASREIPIDQISTDISFALERIGWF